MTRRITRRDAEETETETTGQEPEQEQQQEERFDVTSLRVVLDNLAHSCDHATYVFKVPVPMAYSEDGEINLVPVARICVKKKTWYLTEIKHALVLDQWQRKGIGSYMIQWLLENSYTDEETGEEIQIVRTPTIGCTVDSNNEGAQAFLNSLGFSACIAFRNTQTGNNIQFMMKSLSPIPES